MDMVDVVEEEIVEGMEDDEADEFLAEIVPPEYDEHVWTSPKNAMRIIGGISAGLAEADPVNAALYRANAAAYTAELDKLDAAFQAAVDSGSRKTIVFGDRFPFRYLADAYGLDYFAAFPGCSTETEPSAATIAFLIDKVRAEKIPVIFHIELSNERMADVISEATGAQKLLLHASHNISKKDFEAGVSYLELMRQNVINLGEALR
jgi:zinc transport system substrate-binding protein